MLEIIPQAEDIGWYLRLGPAHSQRQHTVQSAL